MLDINLEEIPHAAPAAGIHNRQTAEYPLERPLLEDCLDEGPAASEATQSEENDP